MLPACGRVGVRLLPRDAGAKDRDAGGGTHDGAVVADGGAASDSGALADAGAARDAGCSTPCENPHGTASCASGVCASSCSTGYADCDGTPTNGCETDIALQAASCGSCTRTCSNAHGSSGCAMGVCTPSCQANFQDCDDNPANGCESDLTSVASCGNCAVSCQNPHGTTNCAAGKCAPSCLAGYGDCDGDAANGCETNTASDPSHCGGCAKTCGSNGQICVSGACQASPCSAGRGECDGYLTVTCETDTTSSLANCGFCMNACTAANGSPRCVASTCQIASCTAGFADCDGTVSNGCEVTLSSNVAHCGACATACTNAHGSTSCAASACAPSCATGYGDCDSDRANGCETPLNTVAHCGGCGTVCPAVSGGTPVCNAGVCGASCDLTGTFALKIVLQTSWAAGSNIQSGNGPHTFWLKLQGTQSGTSVTSSLIECGRDVPPFKASAVSETYKFVLPNTLFDHVPAYLPSSAATLTLSNTSPTATVTLPSTAFLLGTTLTNPVTATWPSAASSLTSVDMDADGKPGMTLLYDPSGSFSQPRTAATLFATRADKPYSATRLVFSLNGSLSSCTQAAGSANVTHIETRIFGCKMAGSTQDCNATESSFLDANCVKYTLGSATYTMAKIADAGTCADVRAQLP
jgi:hypothetical protein